MNGRIALVRKGAGLTQEEFGNRIGGLSKNYIWMLEKGDRTPSDRTIADICREFNVSEAWLRTGEGQPYIQLDEDAEFLKVMEAINISDDDLIRRIIKAYWSLDAAEKAAVKKLIDRFSEQK